jgi:hypothetical protein
MSSTVFHVVLAKMFRISYVLKELEGVEFMGIRCIKGIHIPVKDSNWTNGKTVYIPVDNVSTITEFPSYEDYKDRIKKFYTDKATDEVGG